MNARSKDEIRSVVLEDLLQIHCRRVELSKRINETLEDNVSYFRDLFAQLSQPSSGPLVAKTPKMPRKRTVQRIETIPENEVFQQSTISPANSLQSINEDERMEDSKVAGGRSKRGASKRAAENIKKQSLVLTPEVKRGSQVKRKMSVGSSDEDNERISKYSKVEENVTKPKESTKRKTRKKTKQFAAPIEKAKDTEEKDSNEDNGNFKLPVLRRSSRESSKSSQDKEENKAVVASNADCVNELSTNSIYEDAIGKPVPIMNSTLKNSLISSEKVLGATVIIERLSNQNQRPKLNETVVIQKVARTSDSKKSREALRESAKKTLRDNVQPCKAPMPYKDYVYNGLITDDESSPEIKKPKKLLGKKPANNKQIIFSSDDETPNLPNKTIKTRLRDAAQESKTTYKSNALFSPYAKEPVKKRVEAFEQAVTHSPKSVDIDAPTRMTRTKTRAMINAETEANTKNAEKNVAQMLARKSLAKAKKISLAKQKKDHDEFKEVKESANKELPERINKLLPQTDKLNVKQTQQLKTTPLSKIKLMQPILSVNRLQTPSNAQNLSNYQKSLTASRVNIVTTMESFIQPPKCITKTNSIEKLEEKRRHEEDARKKREEALRLQTEEKRRKRQEKELKNKLAREAKEKQELEKRQKVEKEREEKAKLALLMQEKQREELEKKRLALLQRAQEKEERRKLEEQQRLQRLQEQEETERLLAEQRRREQEAERRKEAEARAQQAAAEALKQKNQLHAATQAKHKANNKHQGTVNYVLDSDPDDDESDDENRPKHEIPYWARAHVRKAQLVMQHYVPESVVYKFFDTRKCTPDLTELFQGIDRDRLKRTSSANWRTPSRASMMEGFNERKLL